MEKEEYKKKIDELKEFIKSEMELALNAKTNNGKQSWLIYKVILGKLNTLEET